MQSQFFQGHRTDSLYIHMPLVSAISRRAQQRSVTFEFSQHARLKPAIHGAEAGRSTLCSSIPMLQETRNLGLRAPLCISWRAFGIPPAWQGKSNKGRAACSSRWTPGIVRMAQNQMFLSSVFARTVSSSSPIRYVLTTGTQRNVSNRYGTGDSFVFFCTPRQNTSRKASRGSMDLVSEKNCWPFSHWGCFGQR